MRRDIVRIMSVFNCLLLTTNSLAGDKKEAVCVGLWSTLSAGTSSKEEDNVAAMFGKCLLTF